MSCWTLGRQTSQGAQHKLHCPSTSGSVPSAPTKCPVCGWFATKSGLCVNQNCGQRQVKLQQAGAWPQPSQTAAQDWQQLGQDAQAQAQTATPATSPDPWTALGLTRQTYDYLQTVGIPPQTAIPALKNKPAATWMYLARCPHCSAWVSPRHGVCKNPRCSRGQDNAQVVEITGWNWPPVERGLLHTQTALRAAGAGTPDAHAAWHERNHRLTQAGLPSSTDRPARFKELREHARVGYRNGWLDPSSPAYDQPATQALRDTAEQFLKSFTDDMLHVMAARRGEWPALTLTGNDLRGYFSPIPDGDRATTRLSAERSFATTSQLKSSDRDMQALARKTAEQLQYLEQHGTNPSLPPDDWPPDFAKQVTFDLLSNLPRPKGDYEGSMAFAYRMMAATRLTGPRSPQRQKEIAQAVQTHAKLLGYPALTAEQAARIVVNGWSPAQARAHFRAQTALESRLRAQLTATATPAEMYQTGRALRNTARRRMRAHPERSAFGVSQAWAPLDMPDPATLKNEQLTALVAGAGAGVVAHADRATQTAWVDQRMRNGELTDLPDNFWTQQPNVVARHLETLLTQRGHFKPGDHLGIGGSVDSVTITHPIENGNQATTSYRVHTYLDGAGELKTRFEKVKETAQL